MPTPQCGPLLDRYLASLRNRYEARAEDHGCLLITPFLLPDNTALTVHLIARPGGLVEVTDYGATFDDFFTGGLNLGEDDKRLNWIGRRFDVTIAGGEIVKVGTPETIPSAIDAVVNAVLAMAYLVYTRNPGSASSSHAEIQHM